MVVHHHDANDVVQNVLVKVFKGIKSFKGNAQLYTWLYRIATNESITYLNKRKKHNVQSIDDEVQTLARSLKADAFFEGDDYERKLVAAIETLPAKQKAVFNLRYYEEMSYKDMSKVMETSEGGLKASYHHAVKKIEQFLRSD